MSSNSSGLAVVTEKTLSELVLLALGTPEVGAVNFNILQTVLLSIIKKLNLQNETATINFENYPTTPTFSNERAQNSRSVENLDRKVLEIQNQLTVLNSLPSNQDLIGKSRSGTALNPAQDMWQNMQLQKKVEINEAGVSKALSLIDELLREMKLLREDQNDLQNKMELMKEKFENQDLSEVMNKIEKYDEQIKTLEEQIAAIQKILSTYPADGSDFESFITWPVLEEALSQHMKKLEEIQSTKDLEGRPTSRMSSASSRLSSARERYPQATDMLEKIGVVSSQHQILEARTDALEDEMPYKANKTDLDTLGVAGPGISDDFLDKLRALQDAVDHLEKEKNNDSDKITNLQTALLNLQAELEKLNRMVNIALDEHTNKQKHIDTLYGATEKLEEKKADKENVQQEIDVKADKRSLETKVNRSDFDVTTSEISKNLDGILEKILGQEGAWTEQVHKLSSKVDGKLDRMELDALKQHLENRLKALKKLLDKRPQQEVFGDGDDAAGFRKQLMQSYHCISCDRPVDLGPSGPMPSIPAQPGLPATKSVRPYTSFELDHIRQQARGISDDSDFVMPSGRSCGGGYTLTYPHRRYTRLTHLSELWQDEEGVVETNREEVELQGHDGHIYKGRLPGLPAIHMENGTMAPPDSGYGGTAGAPRIPKVIPRPSSARLSMRPGSGAARRSPSSVVERPRTAGRVPSHVSVATQDRDISPDSLTGQMFVGENAA